MSSECDTSFVGRVAAGSSCANSPGLRVWPVARPLKLGFLAAGVLPALLPPLLPLPALPPVLLPVLLPLLASLPPPQGQRPREPSEVVGVLRERLDRSLRAVAWHVAEADDRIAL